MPLLFVILERRERKKGKERKRVLYHIHCSSSGRKGGKEREVERF